MGLAIYVFGARPKVVAVAAGGRAAALPFERFTDRADAVAEDDAAIGVLSLPTTIGSFGQTVAPPAPGHDSLPVQPRPDHGHRPPGRAPGVRRTAAASSTIPTSCRSARRPPSSSGATMTEPGTAAPPIVGDPAPVPETPHPGRDRPLLQPPPAHLPRGGPAGRVRVTGRPRHPGGRWPHRADGLGRGGRPDPDRAPGGDLLAGDLPPEAAGGGPHPRIGHGRDRHLPTLAARWMNDPTGRHQYRYWDGGNWTENVYDAGVESPGPGQP